MFVEFVCVIILIFKFSFSILLIEKEEIKVDEATTGVQD